VLATRGVEFEIVVMDDHSSDDTAAIVLALAEHDARIRLRRSVALPAGWNGKQHACWQLAEAARNPILCFMDADVRLEPDCLARMALLLSRNNNSLVSGFPRQVTGTVLEWLLIPLIHFVLLGFLPLSRMRSSTDPAYAAGCGQFLMVDTKDYFRTGGHPAIRETMHDGLRLPRLFREHGLRTDLADLTHLARCRMYSSAAQVWNGLAKNATEGLATSQRIGPVSALLLLGEVWPFIFLPFAVIVLGLVVFFHPHTALVHPAGPLLILAAGICAWLPRFLAARRFRQDWRGALLHPLGILLLLSIQWYALLRRILRRPVSWRDRAYTPSPESKAA
jgi:glycosyltransferase involved in cell wall biosynthesis